jgi:folate-binding protein YgfZ
MGDFEDAAKLWEKLHVRATPVSGEAWNYLNIASGLPVVTEASREAWVAQMLNLQIIDAISFKKGCFPGQEVVARLKYLGKTKRRLYRLEFATDVVPNIGESVIAEGEDAEAGQVVNAVLNPDGKVEVLAVLKIAMADRSLHLADSNGATGQILELPYATDDE